MDYVTESLDSGDSVQGRVVHCATTPGKQPELQLRATALFKNSLALVQTDEGNHSHAPRNALLLV